MTVDTITLIDEPPSSEEHDEVIALCDRLERECKGHTAATIGNTAMSLLARVLDAAPGDVQFEWFATGLITNLPRMVDAVRAVRASDDDAWQPIGGAAAKIVWGLQ
jgi:hypothetical protein